jgi:phosphoglycerol transferase MdoB-like AlkP superfamily enzyme
LSGELRPRSAWAVAGLIGAALARRFWIDEGYPANILFTVAVTLALIALVVLLTRRVLFATVLTGSMVAVVVLAASVKQAVMNMVVHAYDLFFYLGSWSTVSYLWSDHRRYVLAFFAALTAVGIVALLSYRADSTRIPRRWSALALLAFAGLAWYGAQAKGERRHMLFYYENLYVSSFYASWGETLEALWRGALLEAAPRAAAAGPGFLLPAACTPTERPPHIILIHQESVVQPSLFPQLGYDPAVDAFFRSYDDRLYPLRVETYGGASWLTEFSLLAGVSTHSFGGMRQFVQTFTQNRLKDTLPQALERCGYRNVVFYPMMRNFVSNDRFYSSIGLKDIFDMKVQGAKTTQERDRFYYQNALTEMERHFKSSRKPLFTYIQTMMAHWPYNFTYMPEVVVAGGAPGTSPEMHEYLRRVSMAKMDFDFLMQELKRRFPRERFLIVHYGDHHPTATRTLLGFDNDTEAEDVILQPESIGFLTYYAIRGVNYRVPPLPQFDTLDVPYLGTVVLDLARLPLSDSHRERKRLMSLCMGRYYGCRHREEILIFHRRLIESGLMAAG